MRFSLMRVDGSKLVIKSNPIFFLMSRIYIIRIMAQTKTNFLTIHFSNYINNISNEKKIKNHVLFIATKLKAGAIRRWTDY